MLATRNFSGRTNPATMKSSGSCWLLLLVLAEILVLKERNWWQFFCSILPSLLWMFYVFFLDFAIFRSPLKGKPLKLSLTLLIIFASCQMTLKIAFVCLAVFSLSVLSLLVVYFCFFSPSSSCVVTHVKGECSVLFTVSNYAARFGPEACLLSTKAPAYGFQLTGH